MERRVTSHTEEEEMNQRRKLLTLARKGDQKAVDQLFELYQVKVFSGDSLKRKKLPAFPLIKSQQEVPKGSYAPEKKAERTAVKPSLRSDKKNKPETKGKRVDSRNASLTDRNSKGNSKGETAEQPKLKKEKSARPEPENSGTAAKVLKSKGNGVKSSMTIGAKGQKKPVKKK
jgi:hypothetical protein